MKLIDRDVNIPLREIVKKLTFRFIFFESFVYNIQTIIQINSYFIKEEPIMVNFDQWNGFKGRLWKEEINVRDFVQNNYKPYDGDESFLEGPTEATNKLWGRLQELQKEERAKGGVLDMETKVVAGLTAYGPGYIDESMKELEKVVGLQTDKPLKRAFMPYGGIKMAEESCKNLVMNQIQNFIRFSQNIIRHITRVYSMLIHQR